MFNLFTHLHIPGNLFWFPPDTHLSKFNMQTRHHDDRLIWTPASHCTLLDQSFIQEMNCPLPLSHLLNLVSAQYWAQIFHEDMIFNKFQKKDSDGWCCYVMTPMVESKQSPTNPSGSMVSTWCPKFTMRLQTCHIIFCSYRIGTTSTRITRITKKY